MSHSRRRESGRGARQGGSAIWIRYTVPVEKAGSTLEEVLTGPMGISRRMIQRLTRAAGVLLNGRPPYLKRRVSPGEEVAVRVATEEDPGLPPVEMELAIVYEDEHLLVIDKPAGLLVHPVRPSGEATLAHGITHHLLQMGVRTRVRPVHRLDRDTSGLLMVAKHAYVHQALDRQLRERGLRRRYLAFVEGSEISDEGVIDAPIGSHPRDPNLRAVVPAPGDRAVTRFRLRERYGGAALLEVELETGRTHQIRVHMAHVGHPLIGDVRYGASPRALGRQALHAASLSFRHPLTGNVIELSSPLPEELTNLQGELRGGEGTDRYPQG